MRRVTFSIPLMLLLPILLLIAGCGGEAEPTSNGDSQPRERLAVAAAANLKFAFDNIEAAFERQHPNVDVVVTYGSSGNFFAQLSQNAPFDIFFSADTKYPQRLVEEGVASEESYFPYASGRIVVWVPNESTLNLETLGVRAIVDPSVKKIAIAALDAHQKHHDLSRLIQLLEEESGQQIAGWVKERLWDFHKIDHMAALFRYADPPDDGELWIDFQHLQLVVDKIVQAIEQYMQQKRSDARSQEESMSP